MTSSTGVFADVSRETSERLAGFAALLRKWNPVINLVARSTLDALEERHLVDSAQLFQHLPPSARRWADLGSGGGFPGLVIAILAAEQAPDLTVELIESDQRKATFLRTAARELGLGNVTVLAERIESLPPRHADVISARALAPLTELLDHAERHLAEDGIALFPKGARHGEELDAALASWRFDVQKIPSTTDPQAVILKIGGIARV
ncbi:16S rRNA (guanine(527)-N(7))-methyltransferase RsmG [Rhodovulum strictum]|uniref:Ribosomal RNA small subunit methyltransferase G n=1 Tax=Rhodovulum strictum TaxID=58314 RepID=A0A844BB40_9RHOB|nr:16S rRNA (guanine(527)-N(7))-methyltransferase RsmG [Rhodovulum strictum]MRH19879.1 16S rRNA (guanine(527)-N(7))-methyltransferase RsmG [Rhodovulum strictum]